MIAIEIVVDSRVTMISYQISNAGAHCTALAEIQFGRCPKMRRDSNRDREHAGRIHNDANEGSENTSMGNTYFAASSLIHWLIPWLLFFREKYARDSDAVTLTIR